ncbi:hypothetical protein PVAG01_05960 [Phlyctema vagabunda]|uniref:Uncharacterized protein n=1 Tax=Phlyctema vagabunda TaxID=108571 RepID=A0ABR4PEQ5_9HELO
MSSPSSPLIPRHPASDRATSRSIRATTLGRLLILGLIPIVVLSLLSRTAMQHIVFWPSIILGCSFAGSVVLTIVPSSQQQHQKNTSRLVRAAMDALLAVAVVVAMYVVAWKRPRRDRAESLIALVMGFVVGVLQFLIASATLLGVDFHISAAPVEKSI